QQGTEVGRLGQLGEGRVVLRAGDVVEGTVQEERFRGRQIPEELLFLTHHQRDLLQETVRAILRAESGDGDGPFGWIEQARQYFKGGRLSGAVGPEKTDALTGGDREAHVLHRLHVLVRTADERAQGGGEPRLSPVNAVPLSQVGDLDHPRRYTSKRCLSTRPATRSSS